jgi:hypothetical protein
MNMNSVLAIGLLLFPLLVIANQQPQSIPSPQKQVGSVQVQFDVTRVIQPEVIQNTSNPFTWRAYLPVCPAGSTYVGGVNPNLAELDYTPNFPYCNCICKGNCANLPGVTSSGGRLPIYTATVTCAVKVNGWFDTALLSSAPTPPKSMPNASKFSYCQSGACTTNPLPAMLGYSVPTGGSANTIKIDFEACSIANTSQCEKPDQTAPSRY